MMKLIDKAVLGAVSESPGRNASEPVGGLVTNFPEVELSRLGRRQHGTRHPDQRGVSLRRGNKGSTVTTTCQVTGEAVLVLSRNRWSSGGR